MAGRKRKALTDPVATRKPSPEARAVAKAMLEPIELLKGMTAQVETLTQRCEEMATTLDKLVLAFQETGKITEPAPVPQANLLTEPAPTPDSKPLTETTP